jgi:hypothetical protein
MDPLQPMKLSWGREGSLRNSGLLMVLEPNLSPEHPTAAPGGLTVPLLLDPSRQEQ